MYSAIYFPILRGKEGERLAVAHLSPETRMRIRPMFDLSLPDDDDALEQHLMLAADDFVLAWGVGLPIFIDLSRYGPDRVCQDGRHACEHFFECARQLRLQAIPVAGPESHRGPGATYLDAVAAVARENSAWRSSPNTP